MSNFSESFGTIYKAFKYIHEKCENTFQPECGSYLFDGKRYEYYPAMYLKQELLFQTAKDVDSILEIGTYMGHSALIMLAANPKLKLTTIDINSKYSVPATEALREIFPHAQIETIIGNSLDVLPELINLKDKKYDMFHIDGYHDSEVIIKEYGMCKILSKDKKLKVVFDDIDCCLDTVKEIASSEKTEKLLISNCIWRNGYLEIDMSE